MSDFEARYPMARVEWFDCMGVGSWTDLEKVRGMEPLVMVSMGWLVRDDEVCVIVVGARDQREKPDVDSGHIIPRSAVRKVDYLRNDGHPEPPDSEPIITYITPEELGPFTMERATNGFTGEVVPTVGGVLRIGGKQYRITQVEESTPAPEAPPVAGRMPPLVPFDNPLLLGEAAVAPTSMVFDKVSRDMGEPPAVVSVGEVAAVTPVLPPEPEPAKRGFFSFLPWAG